MRNKGDEGRHGADERPARKHMPRLLHSCLHPPLAVLISVPLLSFSALIVVFASGWDRTAFAYVVYPLSAYSLVVILLTLPTCMAKARDGFARFLDSGAFMRKLRTCKAIDSYVTDARYRGIAGLYLGTVTSLAYAAFIGVAGVMYSSVWFISLSVYYLMLGCMRAYLAFTSRRGVASNAMVKYGRIAWALFLINIPMGGMMILMVLTNAGFAYPDMVIYLVALYTFYSITASIVDVVRFRKSPDMILRASKILNFVSAMMSVLALQTAMIALFSTEGEQWRQMMNAITGACIYAIVFLLGVSMLVRGRREKETVLENARQR